MDIKQKYKSVLKIIELKDDVKSVLRIFSAHNKNNSRDTNSLNWKLLNEKIELESFI